jgi:hypothetical protein
MSNTTHTATELIEFRQYVLHPGKRNTLIELFDREFVETQEAVGMDVLGQFRDPARHDCFVWLRGFPNLTARHESLSAFYDGPVWAKHRDAANETMIDSDNVMLLRAVTPQDALPVMRRDLRDFRSPTGRIVVIAEQVDRVDLHIIESFRKDMRMLTQAGGLRTLGLYATEPTTNTFTRLPVRTDRSIVWFGASAAHNEPIALSIVNSWTSLRRECHVLTPTSRSLLDAASTRTA